MTSHRRGAEHAEFFEFFLVLCVFFVVKNGLILKLAKVQFQDMHESNTITSMLRTDISPQNTFCLGLITERTKY